MCHIKQATFFLFKARMVSGRPCGAQMNARVSFCFKLFSGLSTDLPTSQEVLSRAEKLRYLRIPDDSNKPGRNITKSYIKINYEF
jgi:hypothetical protein